MQGGICGDGVRVTLIGFVLQLLSAVIIIERTGADLVSDKGDNLSGARKAKPGVSAFRCIKFWVRQPLDGGKHAAAHRQAVQPEHRCQGHIAAERSRAALFTSGPVPDRLRGQHPMPPRHVIEAEDADMKPGGIGVRIRKRTCSGCAPTP